MQLSAQRHVSGLRPSAVRRVAVRCNATTAPTQLLTHVQEAQYVSQAPLEIDVDALYKRLEARAKAMIQLEEQEIAGHVKVKFVLNQQVGLGESWKIVGKCPELGNMLPEVALSMQWNSGDVWTFEAKIRPGTFAYKVVLRKPDGQYLWEDGNDRVLEVPFAESGDMDVMVTRVKFP